jgi:hypothetical protein
MDTIIVYKWLLQSTSTHTHLWQLFPDGGAFHGIVVDHHNIMRQQVQGGDDFGQVLCLAAKIDFANDEIVQGNLALHDLVLV